VCLNSKPYTLGEKDKADDRIQFDILGKSEITMVKTRTRGYGYGDDEGYSLQEIHFIN